MPTNQEPLLHERFTGREVTAVAAGMALGMNVARIIMAQFMDQDIAEEKTAVLRHLLDDSLAEVMHDKGTEMSKALLSDFTDLQDEVWKGFDRRAEVLNK